MRDAPQGAAAAVILAACVASLVVGAACRRIDDQGVIVAEVVQGGAVVNGSAYDTAEIGGVQGCLIVPSSARLRPTSATEVRVHLRKWLSYHGNPGSPITPRTARRSMGIAVQQRNDCLAIATFGEWSGEEGGAGIDMVVEVPKGLRVERRAELAGPESVAIPGMLRMLELMRARAKLADRAPLPPMPPPGWYTWTRPEAGWKRVTDHVATAEGIAALDSN